MNNLNIAILGNSRIKYTKNLKFLGQCIIIIRSLVGQIYIKRELDKIYLIDHKNTKIFKDMNNFEDNGI